MNITDKEFLKEKIPEEVRTIINDNTYWVPQINDIVELYPESELDKIYIEFPVECKLILSIRRMHKLTKKMQKLLILQYPKSRDVIKTLRDTQGGGLDTYIRSLSVNANGGCGGLYWISESDKNKGRYYAVNNSDFEFIYLLSTEKEETTNIQGSIYTKYYKTIDEPIIENDLYEYGYKYNDYDGVKMINKKEVTYPVYNTVLNFNNLDGSYFINFLLYDNPFF